jgi:hypothetical protein
MERLPGEDAGTRRDFYGFCSEHIHARSGRLRGRERACGSD